MSINTNINHLNKIFINKTLEHFVQSCYIDGVVDNKPFSLGSYMFNLSLIISCIALVTSLVMLKTYVQAMQTFQKAEREVNQSLEVLRTIKLEELAKEVFKDLFEIKSQLSTIKGSVAYESKVLTQTKIDLMALQDRFDKTKILFEDIYKKIETNK